MNKKIIQIFDNHYFANICYYKNLLKNESVLFTANTRYQKGWNLNKCSVTGTNGLINLSIPIEGGRNQNIPYRDVKISYSENWRQQHFKTLLSCYGNSPYFSFYKKEFEEVYKLRFEKLFDFNIHTIKIILRLLKSTNEIIVTDDEPIDQEIIFSKKHIAANPYFNQSAIKYPQVFEDKLGFITNLSILDLLFCMGPNSGKILDS